MIRDRRVDPNFGRRMLTAAILFAAAMVAVGGSIAWTLATSTGKQAGDAQSLSVCCSILLVLAATVYVFVTYGRLMWNYHCPRCGTKAPRVKDAVDTRVRFVCPACHIEWETGWHVSRRGGD